MILMALAAIAAALAARRWTRGWQSAVLLVSRVALPVAIIVVAIHAIGDGAEVGTYWDTGMVVDEGFGSFFRTVGLIGLGLGPVVLPIVDYSLGAKKNPDRSGAPR